MTTSNKAILNRQTMQDLVGDDAELIKQFETDFLKQAKTSLGKIVQLFNDNQLPEIKEEAHFLKTSARAIGAEQAAELLQELEYAGLAADKGECKALIVKLNQAVKLVYGEIVNGS